jgi:hypothetical protein
MKGVTLRIEHLQDVVIEKLRHPVLGPTRAASRIVTSTRRAGLAVSHCSPADFGPSDALLDGAIVRVGDFVVVGAFA